MEDENRAHTSTHFSTSARRQTPAVPTPNWDNEPIPISQNDSRRQHQADKRKSDNIQSCNPSKVQILEDMLIDSLNPKQLMTDPAASVINKNIASQSILTKNHAKNPIYLQHSKGHEPSQIKKGFPFTFFVDSDELGQKQQGSTNSKKIKPNKNPIIPLNSDSNVIPTKKTNNFFLVSSPNNNSNTQNVLASTISNSGITNQSVSSMGTNLKNNLNQVTHKSMDKTDHYYKLVCSGDTNVQIGVMDSDEVNFHIDIPTSDGSRLELPIMVNTAVDSISDSILNRLISPTSVSKCVENNIPFQRITSTHYAQNENVEILSSPLESIRHGSNIDKEKVIKVQDKKIEIVSTSHEISEVNVKATACHETPRIISKTPDIVKLPTTPARISRRPETPRNIESSIVINDTNCRTPLVTQLVENMPRSDTLSKSNFGPATREEKWTAENHLTGSSNSQISQENSVKSYPMPDNLVMSPFIVRTPLKHGTTEATAETRNREIISNQCRQTPVTDASNRSETFSVISYHQTPRPFIPYTPKRIAGEVALTPSNSAYTPSFNPHSSMVPLTPIASGPSQAKNSIKLQNCVSTVSLGCELKLLEIYCRTRFSEYNPSRFHGVIMKILEPRATALVFRSGKIVCTGTRNEHDAYIATRKFARIIQKLGFSVKFLDFKIQNFIATADLRFPVRLEALQQAHGQFSSYEPEIFPGLVYRLVRPRVVLLIFVNGKIVFTGAKTRDEIGESLDVIYPILRSYKKN